MKTPYRQDFAGKSFWWADLYMNDHIPPGEQAVLAFGSSPSDLMYFHFTARVECGGGGPVTLDHEADLYPGAYGGGTAGNPRGDKYDDGAKKRDKDGERRKKEDRERKWDDRDFCRDGDDDWDDDDWDDDDRRKKESWHDWWKWEDEHRYGGDDCDKESERDKKRRRDDDRKKKDRKHDD